MALTRTEKAISMASPIVPGWFVHSVTPGRPTEPTYGFLGTEDSQRYQLWKVYRENGTNPVGDPKANASSALITAMNNFESYLATTQYAAWSNADIASRMMQYLLYLVDTCEAVNSFGTVPPSGDSAGIGTSAPGVGDITQAGKAPSATTPVYVTTGDVYAPELVFGDDGDIVTVS
jgi:hypothetical protein